jgi:hypothetical protein
MNIERENLCVLDSYYASMIILSFVASLGLGLIFQPIKFCSVVGHQSGFGFDRLQFPFLVLG